MGHRLKMALVEVLSEENKYKFAQTSWKELRPDTIEVICQHLDQKKLFQTETRVYRDYRGLWQKIKFNNTENNILPKIYSRRYSSPMKFLFAYLKVKEIELS